MKRAVLIVIEFVQMVLVTIALAIVLLTHILDMGTTVEPSPFFETPRHAVVGPMWTDPDGFTYYFISEPVESGAPRVVVRPCG